MAIYEKIFDGNFSHFLDMFHDNMINSSMTTNYEDGNLIMVGEREVSFLVYERYSAIGSNRVSLSVVVADLGNKIHFTAIPSGGAQGMFMKVNTFGESAFLDVCVKIVENYIAA